MSVPKDRFLEGDTWDDWMAQLGTLRSAWEAVYDAASLGVLRAEFQSVPTPRFVLCLFDPEETASLETVPVLAKACDQTGAAGGVDFRLFPVDGSHDIADQFLTGSDLSLPVCVVFDRDWVQLGVWRFEPGAVDDGLQPLLRGFLMALQGQPSRPWRSGQEMGRSLAKQAERARERG